MAKKVYHDGAVSGARRAVDIALIVLLTALCLVWIYPVFLILINSLKLETAISLLHLLVSGLHLGNRRHLANFYIKIIIHGIAPFPNQPNLLKNHPAPAALHYPMKSAVLLFRIIPLF